MSQDLNWLLSPLPLADFFDRYFEKEVLHISGRDCGYNETIFSTAAFEQMIFQSPEMVRANLSCIRTSKDASGITTDRAFGVPSEFFSKSLSASLQKILNSGYSLVIMHVDRNWLPLARLLREIETFLLNPLDTVLFYSPPQVQGAPPHFDPYDNYILQISGEKDWKIYEPKVVLPLNRQLHSVSGENFGDAVELRLRPGDLLYVPRGVIHEATTGAETSMHLTLYNYAYRWRDLVCDIVERLSEQEVALRRSVPISVSRKIACGASAADAGVANELASLLHYCLDHFATARSVGRHARRLVDNLLPLELGNLNGPSAQGELDGARNIAKRPGMVCYLYDDNDKIVIGFPGGKVSGPALIRPVMEFIAATGEPFRLADLPGDVSLRSKEVLVRRLVREGLLFFPVTE
jgi:Cupin superfamily protein